MTAIGDYPHVLDIPTRWKDNDVYGHVNNVEYYSYFDTVINAWLIREGGLDISAGGSIGLCAESHCTFHASFAFPETVAAGLGVTRLGKRSVSYAIGLFGEGAETPAAEGGVVHARLRRPRDPQAGRDAGADPRLPRDAPAPGRGRGRRVRVCAAVLSEMGTPGPYAQTAPLAVRELELDGPGAGELLVKDGPAGSCPSTPPRL